MPPKDPTERRYGRLNDGELSQVHGAVKRARHRAERVWELLLRLAPYGEMVPWAQRETEHWDRVHGALKAERKRRRKRSR